MSAFEPGAQILLGLNNRNSEVSYQEMKAEGSEKQRNQTPESSYLTNA